MLDDGKAHSKAFSRQCRWPYAIIYLLDLGSGSLIKDVTCCPDTLKHIELIQVFGESAEVAMITVT